MPSNRGNVRCQYKGITFDSQFERNVYTQIEYALYPHRITEIECQKKILIKPATKRFPAQYWRCDFYIPALDIFIEAKGRRESSWLQQLKLMDVFNPSVFERLLIVSEKAGEKVCRGLTTIDTIGLRQILSTKALERFKR